MLIFRLVNFLRGFVVINLNTSNYEKTLNLLQRKNIRLWDIEKNENGIKFKMSYNDFKKYSKLVKETNLEPVKKSGFVLKLNKIKFRKGFIAGVVIVILCFVVLTSMVWNIEVVGTNQIFTNEIIAILEENNVKTPSISSKINEKHIETILYKNFNNLKFVEAYIEGSKLIIFVREKDSYKTVIKEDTPSSIISTKNAVIYKIIAKSGQPVVRVGDVVYEGQTLVMGIVKNKNSDDFMMVPSDGSIYGKTYYNFELKEEKVKDMTISTNESKSSYLIKINDKKLKIIGDIKPFKNYNYKEHIIKLPVISNLTNITLVKGVYYEEKTKAVQIDETSAKNALKVNMYDELIKLCDEDSRILNSSLKFTEDENYYYLNAQLEIIEDIGEKVKIYPSEITEETNTDETKED